MSTSLFKRFRISEKLFAFFRISFGGWTGSGRTMKHYRVRVQPGLASVWVDETGKPSLCLLETPEKYAAALELMVMRMNELRRFDEIEHD